MLNNRRSIIRGISSGIILIGLPWLLLFGGFNLPVFFVALAFSILIGSLSSSDPNNIFAGIQGFFWMLILSLFFITGSWIWFLVGVGISVFLGAMMRPILVAIAGMNILGMAPTPSSPSQYYQPARPMYQPYKE